LTCSQIALALATKIDFADVIGLLEVVLVAAVAVVVVAVVLVDAPTEPSVDEGLDVLPQPTTASAVIASASAASCECNIDSLLVG
jgi:hypothetical protein